MSSPLPARHLALLAVPACLAATSTAAQTLQILTTDVPPMAFMKDGAASGVCIEMVKEIQRRIGDGTPITFMPWPRAYKAGLEEANTILVCPKRTPEREALFQWVGPLLESHTNFYARRGSGIKILSLDDARKLSGILVQREYYTYEYLHKEGFSNLYPVNKANNIVRLLLLDRQPVMLLDQQQLPELLQQAEADRRSVEVVFSVLPTVAALTFSKDVPTATVKRWQEALDAMKRDKTYQQIHRKWFPDHSPPVH